MLRAAALLAALSFALIAAFAALAVAAPAAKSSTVDPIVGGEPAGPAEYPAQSLVTVDLNGNKGWFCGGTLVAPTKVLTAGHCATDRGEVPEARVQLFLGENDRT